MIESIEKAPSAGTLNANQTHNNEFIRQLYHLQYQLHRQYKQKMADSEYAFIRGDYLNAEHLKVAASAYNEAEMKLECILDKYAGDEANG